MLKSTTMKLMFSPGRSRAANECSRMRFHHKTPRCQSSAQIVGDIAHAQCASVQQVQEVKSHHEIPGPVGLPLIGTLYKYLPWGEYTMST